DTIKQILLDSLVIVMFEPRLGNPSAGVNLERTILGDLIQRPSLFKSGFPMLLRFSWSGSDSRTFSELPITYELSLPTFDHDVPGQLLSDSVSAICCAWLVHNLQCRFDNVSGQYLIHLASLKDTIIKSM